MKIAPPYRGRKKSACAQLYRLKHDFPGSKGWMLSSVAFVWNYSLRPSLNSDSYDIEIRYNEIWPYPKVFVKNQLKLYPGENKLPHVFDSAKQHICLNYHSEWDKTRPISTYYVPWASEWLFYYETWVVIGEWLGGGIHDGKRYE